MNNRGRTSKYQLICFESKETKGTVLFFVGYFRTSRNARRAQGTAPYVPALVHWSPATTEARVTSQESLINLFLDGGWKCRVGRLSIKKELFPCMERAPFSFENLNQLQLFSFVAFTPAIRPNTRQSMVAQLPRRTAPCTPPVSSPAANNPGMG